MERRDGRIVRRLASQPAAHRRFERAHLDHGSDAFLGIQAPIAGVAGDQQAALFGQACTKDGMAKNTYGTGSFVLMQTGKRRVASGAGILTTVPWRRPRGLSYALEGAIFLTRATLQWLRDRVGVIA